MNGDVQSQVSNQYLQAFNLPIGVSGMQKLQQFPALQKLGYAGQLGSMKNDFHGLVDFNQQLAKYSTASGILGIAWSLIKYISPNNPNIARLLFTAPGLGTVGQLFQTIHGFGQVFALTPNDLTSPAAVSAKASVYQNSSTQNNVTTQNSAVAQIGGGASTTAPGNASQINGLTVIGLPTLILNTLQFNGTNLVWVAPPQGGGGGNTDDTAEDLGLIWFWE